LVLGSLGQFARRGAAMVARWDVGHLLGLPRQVQRGSPAVYAVASDFWLYYFYNRTVGHAVLDVSGDESSGADGAGGVLVYAHCAAPTARGPGPSGGSVPPGAVTLLVANPGNAPVALSLDPRTSGVASTLARVEYVLTAPGGDDIHSHTPVLNGDESAPLALGVADASLPSGARGPGRFCGSGSGDPACGEQLQVPALSQGFFVLLGASAAACRNQ
jgi:hypothetical protein